MWLAQWERISLAPWKGWTFCKTGFLDDTHLPAETIDGRMVLVFGTASTAEEVTLALEQGADSLFVPFDAPLNPAEVEDVTQRRNIDWRNHDSFTGSRRRFGKQATIVINNLTAARP